MRISEQIDSICRYDASFDECLKPTDKITAQRYIELLKLRQESYAQETRYLYEKQISPMGATRFRHKLLDKFYRVSINQDSNFPSAVLNKVKSLLHKS